MVESCEECQSLLPSQTAEPLEQTTATFPMEKVSMDLYSLNGKQYLVMSDRYSGYPFVHLLRKETTAAVTTKLQEWFSDLGRPTSIRSDGGPQFRGEFKEFCAKLGIEVETSSPRYPQSNGHAESAVKQVKNLLKKYHGVLNQEFKDALQEWRNCPRSDGFSPAQMFFSRRQRSSLPTLPQALAPIDHSTAQKSRQNAATKKKVHFDQTARTLEPLTYGQRVRVQDPTSKRWTHKGVITKTFGRRYSVKLEGGGEWIRNRVYIRPQK